MPPSAPTSSAAPARTIGLLFCGLLLCCSPLALADPPERAAMSADQVKLWFRDVWNHLLGGEPEKLKESFSLETFVDYAASDLPIAPLYRTSLKKGLRQGMNARIGPMVDQLVKDWANGWLDVYNPRQDDQSRWMIDVALYDYRSGRLNISTWRIQQVDGKPRWFDFQEMINGTWMKTRMTGVTVLLLTLKIKPTEVHRCRQLGDAAAAGRWDEVKAIYGQMSPTLQKHRAVLPTARMAALQLEDKAWLVTLRQRWMAALGTDTSLLFGDIDHYAILGKGAASLTAAQQLRDKMGGHALLRFKVSQVAHQHGNYDVARDSAQAAMLGASDFHPAYLAEISAFAGLRDHAAAVKAAVAFRKRWPKIGRKVHWINRQRFHDMPTSPEFFKAFGYMIKPKPRPGDKPTPGDPPKPKPKPKPGGDAPKKHSAERKTDE